MTGTQAPTTDSSNVRGERLLERLNLALVREPRPDIVVRAALDSLVSEVGATSAALYFTDIEAGVSRPVYTVNYPPDIVEAVREVPLSVPAMSNIAIATGEVVCVANAESPPPGVPFSVELGVRMGIKASAAVPLMSTGRIIGVLVYNLSEEHTFTDSEIQMLREVGNRIAAALERARLEEELTRRVEETELLYSIASSTAGEDDLCRMLSATLDRLATLMQFTGGSIALIDGDDLVIDSAFGPFSAQALGQKLPRGRGLAWQIIDSGQPFLSNNLSKTGHRPLSGDEDKKVLSYIGVPLIWREKALGLLEIDSLEQDAFKAEDLPLMQAVGALLSGPIEMARRYQAEVQLRRDLDEVRGRLEAILEHAPMGVLFFDRDHRLAYVNQAAVESLHLLPQQEFMLGRSWLELATLLAHRRWDHEPSRLIEMIQQTQELRDGVQVDDLPLHDPEQMLLRIVAPVFDSGEFAGHVIIMIDVTAERSALQEAEQAIALRDRFISIASHELKTPLTSIKGAAQLLLRMRDAGHFNAEIVWKHLGTIDAQASRIRMLIDEILDVSRIQAGMIELRREPMDLGGLVSGVVGTLPEEQRERVHLAVAGPVPGVWDPLRLEQVTLNLLDNALKYSAAATTVDVRVEREGDTALLTVRDDGIGIPDVDLPHLFEPFARASNASVHDDKGLGLGLYITRQIIEQHGGTITVESVEGQGTVFRVGL